MTAIDPTPDPSKAELTPARSATATLEEILGPPKQQSQEEDGI